MDPVRRLAGLIFFVELKNAMVSHHIMPRAGGMAIGARAGADATVTHSPLPLAARFDILCLPPVTQRLGDTGGPTISKPTPRQFIARTGTGLAALQATN